MPCTMSAALSGGSSPRVWGTPAILGMDSAIKRFIPTGVGNTPRVAGNGRGHAVHPHGCGEHGQVAVFHQQGGGSSPRVWGTLHKRIEANIARRFIPTGVGNTSSTTSTVRSASVHPHGCGEHKIPVTLKSRLVGSSPRVWGTLWLMANWYRKERFIPTGVGNTITATGVASWRPVHPHGCGEHVAGALIVLTVRGSSPRVWGTPQ